MKKIFLLCLSVALIFILSACKKDKPNWPTEWYVPQELLDYFYFQPNSVWVYENDKTGELDTVVINACSKETFNGYNGEHFEIAKSNYYSLKDGYTCQYYCNTQASAGCIKDGKNNRPCYGVWKSRFKPGEYIGENLSFLYSYMEKSERPADYSDSNSYIKLDSSISSLAVSGETYNNVIKVTITKEITNDRKSTSYYMAKDYGIIKKEILNDSQSWNLIYSQVIK